MNNRNHAFKNRKIILLLAACILAAVLILIFSNSNKTLPELTEGSIPDTLIEQVQPAAESTLEPVQPPTATPEPTPEPTPSPTPEPTTVPIPELPEIPEQEKAAEDEYFADAAFLGNSLVDGFRLWSGLSVCDVYAETSMTVLNAQKLIDKMGDEQYGKIYMLFGINELYLGPEKMAENYGKVIDTLREKNPDAIIYVMAVTPVSKSKSESSQFTKESIEEINEALYGMAEDKECWYVDLFDALSNDEGYLPDEVTSDGVHFTPSYYKIWLDYLRTHYV